jgi:hypothetical protein
VLSVEFPPARPVRGGAALTFRPLYAGASASAIVARGNGSAMVAVVALLAEAEASAYIRASDGDGDLPVVCGCFSARHRRSSTWPQANGMRL